MSAVLSKVSLVLAILSTAAFGSGRVRIVGAIDLLKTLDKVRIVDSRERGDFEKGHIPGARHMAWKDWTEERPGWWNYFFGDPKLWGRVILDDKIGERLSA